MKDYSYINNFNDTEELIDLFYEKLNTEEAFDSLPICLKIVNRIKVLKKEYNEEEELLFLELRNLYVFLLARINEAMFALRFGCAANVEPKELNGKVYLGYCVITKNYDQDSNNFVAENMIKDLFNKSFPNYKIDIEADLHKKFSTKEKVTRNGIYKSIIDVISDYDPFLSDNITCNIDVLKTVQDKIDRILFNYENFDKENEKKKYIFMMEDIKDYFIDKVMEYSDKYNNDYLAIKDIVTSANRNEIDFNYITLMNLVEEYLNTNVITERLSDRELDQEFISKLDRFILDYSKLEENERLFKSLELFNMAKDNREFDKALEYINKNINFKGKKVLEFRKKEFK